MFLILTIRVIPFHGTNGDVYTGDWRDGVPQGHGEFDYGSEKEGERYVGQYDKVTQIILMNTLVG